MIEKYRTNAHFYHEERKRHIQKLKERANEGHEHPRHEKK
jgi:hypothetical protein